LAPWVVNPIEGQFLPLEKLGRDFHHLADHVQKGHRNRLPRPDRRGWRLCCPRPSTRASRSCAAS
jgi:hypothetical protein